jgi:hypothetical protein
MKTIVATSIAAVSAAALTLGLAGTANAEQYAIDDPNDSPHGSDLIGATVRNNQQKVVVITDHANLRRDPSSGSAAAIFIDTDPEDHGPEYVFVGGLFEGTDYNLIRTEGFAASQWGNPVHAGSYSLDVDYRDDQARFELTRPALGNPEDIRVAIRVSGTRNDGTSHGLTDWLGTRRAFTLWIARG